MFGMMHRNAPIKTLKFLDIRSSTSASSAIRPLPKITPMELHIPENMFTRASMTKPHHSSLLVKRLAGLFNLSRRAAAFSIIQRNIQIIIGNTRFATIALPCQVLIRKKVAGV